MKRTIAAVVAALVAWLAVATLCGLILRATWPAYVLAEPVFAFTLPMLAGRLAIGAISTIASGAVAALVAKGRMRAVWAAGTVLLLLFVPQHIHLFAKFPLWYHAVFLVSLIPLTWAGARLVPQRTERQIDVRF